MNILITGMQRSGTTLLRRIFQVHPEVRHMFHESFFLTKFNSSRALRNHINSRKINSKKDIWGEKCPYYPNIRKIKIEDYCKKAHQWYPKKFRVVHVVRHPLDIANSNVKKFDYIKSIDKPLNMYKNIIPRIIPALDKLPYVIQIKFENLVMNPEDVVPQIYEFCNLNPDVDFTKHLAKLENPVYRKIRSDRAFDFRKSEQKLKVSFDEVFKVANTIEGPNY